MSDFSITKINEKIEKQSKFVEIIKNSIGDVIVGQNELIDKILIGVLSKGHLLLEGVPGLAKTLTVNVLARTIETNFQRIQFTPDMLPADLLGTLIFNQKLGKFETRKGPIFSNIILADEINRAPSKVQSALLECMQEKQVTISEDTFILESPFVVIATQNPLEQEGTYPLPEAQLDRFMFQLWVDYPTFDQEKQIIIQTTSSSSVNSHAQMNKDDILQYQELIREVPIPSSVLDYTVSLVNCTRPNADNNKSKNNSIANEYLSWGAGPRASQNLILAAKSKAMSEGRFNITEEDIKFLAVPVLRHRIIPNYTAEAQGLSSVDIVDKILSIL